ncbi:MAG: PDZ domain-containing protein, partial [Cyclobacteriaceae bacterium]
VNGEEFKNVMNINKHLMVRDVNSVTVLHNTGQKEILAIPDSIGTYLFKVYGGKSLPIYPRMTTTISGVADNYPAKTAGLEKGDVIVSVNGKDVAYFDEIAPLIIANDTNELTVTSNGELKSISLLPNPENNKFGISGELFHKLNYVTKEYTFGEAFSG